MKKAPRKGPVRLSFIPLAVGVSVPCLEGSADPAEGPGGRGIATYQAVGSACAIVGKG